MRLLRALTLPLVSVSMASGVASLAERAGAEERRGGASARAGRVASRVLACYALTTLCAVALGLLVVALVRPGEGVSLAAATCERTPGAPRRRRERRPDRDRDVRRRRRRRSRRREAVVGFAARIGVARPSRRGSVQRARGRVRGEHPGRHVRVAVDRRGAASALASEDGRRRRAPSRSARSCARRRWWWTSPSGGPSRSCPPGCSRSSPEGSRARATRSRRSRRWGSSCSPSYSGLALHLFAVAPGLYALATRRGSGGAAKTRSPENENAHSSSPAHRSAARVVARTAF